MVTDLCGRAQPIAGSRHPWAGVRKQDEQAIGARQEHSSIAPTSVPASTLLLWVPSGHHSVTECEPRVTSSMKLFPSQVASSHGVFITTIERQSAWLSLPYEQGRALKLSSVLNQHGLPFWADTWLCKSHKGNTPALTTTPSLSCSYYEVIIKRDLSENSSPRFGAHLPFP